MGVLQSSRASDLPENINDPDIRAKITDSWTESNILAYEWNISQSNPTTTMNTMTIKKAGEFIKNYFQSQKNLSVLEIFSGNCIASLIVQNILDTENWICTDAIDHKCKPDKIIFDKLNSVDAVGKYGDKSNILLMISYSYF